MTFRFEPDARVELEEAIQYYQQRNEEVAQHFITAVENAISRAMANPLIYRLQQNQYRFCKIDVFPYHLVFRFKEDQIEIFAIAHTSRKPGYWNHRAS